MADDLVQVGCEDCGAPYGKDGWCDAVIPDAIWNSLGAGLLCFRCMTKRLEGSYEDVPVLIASGPYKDSQETWRLLGWEHGYKVGLQEADDAIARKDAEIARLTAAVEELRVRDAERLLLYQAVCSQKTVAYDELAEAERARERAYDNRDMALQGMEAAELDRDAQRQRAERAEARVREAPVADVYDNGDAPGCDAWINCDVPLQWSGKRVALVLLDTEEAK